MTELHIGYRDAGLHHIADIRIGLLIRRVVPLLADARTEVVRLVRSARAEQCNLALYHLCDELARNFEPACLSGRAIIFEQALKAAHHLIGLRYAFARIAVVPDILWSCALPYGFEYILPLAGARLLDDVSPEPQILLTTRQPVELHYRLQYGRRLDAVERPAGLGYRSFGRRADLTRCVVGQFYHCTQRVLAHGCLVIRPQPQQHILALPQIRAVSAVRLRLSRRGADFAVLSLHREHIGDRRVDNRFQRFIPRILIND